LKETNKRFIEEITKIDKPIILMIDNLQELIAQKK